MTSSTGHLWGPGGPLVRSINKVKRIMIVCRHALYVLGSWYRRSWNVGPDKLSRSAYYYIVGSIIVESKRIKASPIYAIGLKICCFLLFSSQLCSGFQHWSWEAVGNANEWIHFLYIYNTLSVQELVSLERVSSVFLEISSCHWFFLLSHCFLFFLL
jgi:hypothetical protein